MEPHPTATLRLPDARLLAALLRAIKDPADRQQLCALVIADDGLTLRWEDDSKALQASISLPPALFSQFDVPWARRTSGVRLHHLTDALAVFTSGGPSSAASAHAPPPAELVLRSPGADGAAALELASVEGAGGAATAALLDAVDAPPAAGDLGSEGGWARPAASLVAPAALLREAVDDLEWGAAAGKNLARLTLSAAAAAAPGGGGAAAAPGPRAVLSAGPGPGGEAVEVDLPVSCLAAFEVSDERGAVSHAYRYRLLRAALAAGAARGGGGGGGGGGLSARAAPHAHPGDAASFAASLIGGGGVGGAGASGGAGATTKLAVDGRGVLRATHLVPVEAGGGGGGGGGGGAGPPTAVVQFVVLPAVDEAADDGGGSGEGDVYRGPTSGAAAALA